MTIGLLQFFRKESNRYGLYLGIGMTALTAVAAGELYHKVKSEIVSSSAKTKAAPSQPANAVAQTNLQP